MQPWLTALGVISGTSADGVDVAPLRSNGELVQPLEPGERGATYAYDPTLRERLLHAMRQPPARGSSEAHQLEQDVTRAHVEAVQRFLHATPSLRPDVIGLHGQTIWHAPAQRQTWQLLDGALAARLLACDVVCDFRSRDVAAGGQGAPLVPLYHQALARTLPTAMQPLAVLNWGGVGNLTYVSHETLLAFDTGPANALLDDWVRQHGRGDCDVQGRFSAAGKPRLALVQAWLQHPFFALPPPKSLDRQHFHALMAQLAQAPGLSFEDGAATLAHFTVEATARAQDWLPQPPRQWLVAGGGRHNATLMHLLRTRLGVPVEPVEHVGWQGDWLEAQCFAFLAVRTLKRLPLSLPTTTGVPQPMTGGALFRWPAGKS